MKRSLAVLLTICMMLPLLAALPLSAATAPTEGVQFSDNEMYYMNGTPEAVPHTFEAWIYIPEELPAYVGGDSRLGTIISNYSGFPVMPYIHFAVLKGTNGYYPSLEWKELYNTNNRNSGYHTSSTASSEKNELRTVKFEQAEIPVGEWTHIAVTVDARSTSAHAYKNGELAQTVTGIEFFMGDLDVRLVDLPFVVGNDNRNGQPYYFRGKLASLSLYESTRTAAQIKADYEQGPNTSDEDLLGHWTFASADGKLPATVQDLSGNGLSLSHNRMWIDATEADFATLPDNYAYTMIAVGDTQYMVQDDANKDRNNTDLVYGWIADHADELNLKIVMGLGDITNTDTDDQWTVAYNALTKLNGIVPYTLVRGNHDLLNGGSKFDELFGTGSAYMAQFSSTDCGVMTEGSVTNTYYTFNAEGTKWLVVNLDWAPTDAMLDWADLVIATHKDHKVIVNTHCYAHLDYTTCDKEDTSSNLTDDQNYGDEIWEKLIYHHENIVMVLSGHQESNLVTMFQAQSKHGNTVSQFLIDPQAIDTHTINSTYGDAPSGLITIFYFDKDGRTVDVRHYSPVRNQYYSDRNQISFDLEAEAPLQDTSWNGYAIAPKGSGTEDDPYIVENGGNLIWMGNQINDRVYYDYDDYEAGVFNNTYFKQVCDIDLNGLCVSAIGHSYTTEYKNGTPYNQNWMTAFGGHYDGGGYRIHNGRIINDLTTRFNDNYSWATGLFGCIYGATIENVTLDNVTVYSDGVTGGIVGRAAAPADGNAPSDFNVISNCHLTSSCDIVARFPYGKVLRPTKLAYDTIFQFGAVGSICGMALATTVENCTSAVEFSVDGHHALVGGIVATAGYNTVVDHCAFTGGVTLTDNVTIIEQTFGGIVGLITPNADTEIYANVGNIDLIGTVRITNCYNTGYLSYTGSAPYSYETRWGGILGHAPALPYLPYEEMPFLIENCHNLCALIGAEGDFVGGIVAKVTMGARNSALTVKNCFSVAVTAAGGSGTNEYRVTADGAVVATDAATCSAEAVRTAIRPIALEIAMAANGESGKWIVGEGAPTEAALPGDIYLDNATGNVYQYGLDWELVMNIKGPQGEKGETGETGAQGPQGEKGETGETGPQGPQGEKGETGETGAQGPQGEKGETGETGAQGPQGEKGETGETGAQGPQGEKGETGETGAQGPQGEKGETGETGAQGPQGEPGKDGKDGKDGADAAVSSDSANTAGGSNNGDAATTSKQSGNGLAIAAIVIAVVLGAVNAALMIVLFKKKKTA